MTEPERESEFRFGTGPEQEPEPEPEHIPPFGPDPWKGFRGVMAATLILEAIVVLLAIPVVGVVGRGVTLATGGYLVGVAVMLICLAGLQSRPLAIGANLAMQLVVIGGVFVHPAIGFVGGLFTVVWLLILYLKIEVSRRQERGELPGQQQPE